MDRYIWDNTTRSNRSHDIMGWLRFSEKVKKFENSCTLRLFAYLFNPMDGNRDESFVSPIALHYWNVFRDKCNGDLKTFRTCLTDDDESSLLHNLDQNNELWSHK